MTFGTNTDADPDPTTQMAWPSSRRNAPGSHILKSNYHGGGVESPQGERGPLRLNTTTANIKTLVNPNAKRLTTKDLIFLTISMAGAQIAWTVELGYVFMAFGFVHLMSLLAADASLYRRGAYELCGQIWNTFLVKFGSIGTAHFVGLARRPHQRADRPASHRCVHLLRCLPLFLYRWLGIFYLPPFLAFRQNSSPLP